MSAALRAAGLVAIAGLAAIAVLWLRDATQSTHYDTGPDSRLQVVVEAESNRAEPTQTLAELTQAHLMLCRLEVNSDPVGPIEAMPGRPDSFAVVLQPALDSTDRKQYEGCIEDWVLDHHRLTVVEMKVLR